MAALARGKMMLQENTGSSFSNGPSDGRKNTPFPIHRANLIRPQVRHFNTVRATPNNCYSLRSPFKTTLIMPTQDILDFTQKFSTQEEGTPFRATKVWLPKEVDVTKFVFKDPVKSNKSIRSFVPLLYEESRFRIQTPELRVPFLSPNFSNPESETQSSENITTLSMNLSFEGMDADPQIKQFVDFLSKFDSLVKEEAKRKSAVWFGGKSYTPEVIDFQYRTTIKPSKDDKYPPTMKLKIPTSETGAPKATFTDVNGQVGGMDLITHRCKVKAILEVGVVWFGAGQFGVSWKGLSFKVTKPGVKKGGIEFREDP